MVLGYRNEHKVEERLAGQKLRRLSCCIEKVVTNIANIAYKNKFRSRIKRYRIWMRNEKNLAFPPRRPASMVLFRCLRVYNGFVNLYGNEDQCLFTS